MSRPRILRFEPLESRRPLAATPISVLVAGSTGTETFQLQIDGIPVASYTNTQVLTAARQFDAFNYTHPTDVSIDRIRVAFTNDGTAAGVDRNLFVDGVTLNGQKFESEAPSVYSTGTWSATTGGRLPGFRQTEALHYNGYLQYGAAGATIEVRAAGRTGEEQMQLQIDGTVVATFSNVGGNYATGQFGAFTYHHPSAVALSQVRVAYVNDGATASGVDRNLRVDAVLLNGVRHETEAASTFSTGLYVAGQGRATGRLQTEYLHLNGYFQFGAAGSIIEVRAAGRSGEETIQLNIAGQTVRNYTNVGGDYANGQYQTLIYVHPTTISVGQINVAFTNDGTSAGGLDRNVRIDGVAIDGVLNQSEAANVFSTGTYIAGIGRMPGLWQSEFLHTNGSLQYGSTAVPGVLALGTSLISVNEAAGTVSIPVIRTGGSDGTVGVQYTTVNASATAGNDYTARSGLLIFAPGETAKSIVVPIANDTADETNETFNLAVDQAVGGATVNQPRTATVTIVDNDGPPAPGTGNGLLGAYFNDLGFSSPVLERTDATVNFDYGAGSPAASVGGDTFSVRWTGRIEPLYSETYTFRTTSDDGVRLYVNGQHIIDQWNDHAPTDHFGSIALVGGQKYDIVLEYYEGVNTAMIKLAWASTSQAWQIVPQSQLYSDPPAPPETGAFSTQTLASGLQVPTAIDFDASGRMFIAEQRGVVRLYQNGQLLSTPFLDIRAQVNYVQDRGLIGIAVHPNFPATPYVYVSYTYDPVETQSRSGLAGPDGSGNRVARVSRFTANSATGFTTALPGSEVVLVGTNSTWANISHPELDSTNDITLPPSGGQNGELRDILIADSRSHTVGNIVFGPDGKLYVSNGDGTSYGRVDPRTARVQSIDSLSGKLLRIDPITGAGLADNPFYNGDPGANRSRVFDYGLRNPFRFALHPVSGQVYIGDVGWNTWEEINTGGGRNFGWPYFEGGSGGASLQTGGYRDLPEAAAFYASNPAVAAPLWARSHSDGGVAIVVGDFYTGSAFPASYRNALFFSDFGDNQIRVLRLNANGNVASVAPLGANPGGVVEMSMGRDGNMYYVDLVNGAVGRFVYTPAASSLLAAPGDFDGSGTADGTDFLAWQRQVGQPTDGEFADSDGDGVGSAGDLAMWEANYSLGEPEDEEPLTLSANAATTGASIVQSSDDVGDGDAAVYWLAYRELGDDSVEDAPLEAPQTIPLNSPKPMPASDWTGRHTFDDLHVDAVVEAELIDKALAEFDADDSFAGLELGI